MNTETNNQASPTSDIRELVKMSPTAKAIVMNLSCRDRHSHTVPFPRFKNELIRQGDKVVDLDMQLTFDALETAGYGKVVHSRNAKEPSRFEFHRNFKDIAEVTGVNTEELKAKKDAILIKRKAIAERTPKQAPKEFNRSEYMKKLWIERKGKVTDIKHKAKKVSTKDSVQLTTSEAKVLAQLLKKLSA